MEIVCSLRTIKNSHIFLCHLRYNKYYILRLFSYHFSSVQVFFLFDSLIFSQKIFPISSLLFIFFKKLLGVFTFSFLILCVCVCVCLLYYLIECTSKILAIWVFSFKALFLEFISFLISNSFFLINFLNFCFLWVYFSPDN